MMIVLRGNNDRSTSHTAADSGLSFPTQFAKLWFLDDASLRSALLVRACQFIIRGRTLGALKEVATKAKASANPQAGQPEEVGACERPATQLGHIAQQG